MPNGTWIVRSWRIRMPLARPATSPLTGKDLAVLAGIEVEGGDVIRVHENDGTIAILESGPRGRIAGSVLDTLNAGLPGARVCIEGTGIESRTDGQGRFELNWLDPGVYTVNYTHPYVESYSYAPEPVEVEVADAGSPAEVDFSTPSVPWLVNHICRDEKRGHGYRRERAANGTAPGCRFRAGTPGEAGPEVGSGGLCTSSLSQHCPPG